jgi:hypothetical protein
MGGGLEEGSESRGKYGNAPRTESRKLGFKRLNSATAVSSVSSARRARELLAAKTYFAAEMTNGN